MQVVARKPC